jgi:uncharacterized protein YjbI with pentapeptide repeats
MANDNQVRILKQGTEAWNAWRRANRQTRPDLEGADLREQNLAGVNLRGADLRNADFHQAKLSGGNLRGARLRGANLYEVDFREVDLRGADLRGVNLRGGNLQKANLGGTNFLKANLSHANLNDANLEKAVLVKAELSGDAILSEANLKEARLTGANLIGANLDGAVLSGANLYEVELTRASLAGADLSFADLSEADLQEADFSGASLVSADLSHASLVRTNLDRANLTGCRVYGCSVWDVRGEPAAQNDVLISHRDDGDITTDDIEVAQFIYLMYDNQKIRNVIDSITSKGVLILGRFSPPERKVVLDGLRGKLREFNLLPIVFDFDRPADKDYTETVQTLAGMSLFVIADVTSPKSIPLELEATVKQFKIPYLPIIDTRAGLQPFSMLVDLQKNFHWVLGTLEYDAKEQLLDNIQVAIIDRALAKHNELQAQKAREPQTLTIADLLRK